MKAISWLKSLSFIAKLSGMAGGLMSLGFLGPVAPFVFGFFKLIGVVIGWIWDGIQVSISKPVVLALEVLILAFGIWQGVKWDAHLVRDANQQVASLEAKMQAAKEIDDARAKAAIEAREAAKRQPPIVAPTPAAAPAGVPKPAKRLRKSASASDDSAHFAFGLPSF